MSCSVLELCWCRFSARSKSILRLRRPCGWPGTCRLLGPPWSFQGQGSWGLQEAGLMLMPCLAGRSSWMICLMFSNTLTLPTFGHCRRRETEIKHGRVAMFATMGQKLKQVRLHSWMRQWPCMNFGFFIILVQGYIAPEYYRFDGYLSPSMNLKFSDVPNGLKVQLRRWCRMIFSSFQRFSLGFNMFCFNDIFSINVNFRCFPILMLHLNSFERFEPSWSWWSIVPP